MCLSVEYEVRVPFLSIKYDTKNYLKSKFEIKRSLLENNLYFQVK